MLLSSFLCACCVSYLGGKKKGLFRSFANLNIALFCLFIIGYKSFFLNILHTSFSSGI